MVKGLLYLYNNLCAHVELEKTVEDKVSELKRLYETAVNSLKVVTIETTDECEAFMIFETLNARGRDLETSDLLKNYMFRVSGSSIDAVKNNWQTVATAFESGGLTDYIRCIWNSQQKFEREKMLYRQLTNTYKTAKNCFEFSKLMLDGKDMYLSMVDPENKHCFSSGKGKQELENILLDLSDLKVKTFYPLVMAYYLRFMNDDKVVVNLVKIVRAIETLIFRDIVISKKSPNSYEVIFSQIAKDITDMTLSTVDEICARLKEKSVSDAEFEASFSVYSETDSSQGKNKIRYILRKIINFDAKEMVVKRNNSEVHIEHIMPVKIGKWKIDQEEHDEYLWRIGNLTLLDFEINEDIQNSTFDIKTEEYKKSEINMTKQLHSDYAKWDISTIVKRQDELKKKAFEVWKF